MSKKIMALILAILFLALPAAAFAADITGAKYIGNIQVTENGTAETSDTATVFTGNLTDYFNAGRTNAAIQYSGSDTAFMPPPPGSSTWVLWVDDIGATQNLDYDLYIDDATGGKLRYFPDDGGMTTPDDGSIELGDNWTVEQKGWIDTASGADKNLVYKEDAFRTYISDTGEITSATGFSDNLTADAWTDVGTKITVSVGNSRIDYEAERSAVDNRCYYDLTTVSDSLWSLEFTWHPISTANPVNNPRIYFGIGSILANANGYAADALWFVDYSNTGARINALDGGASTNSASIATTDGNTYYVTMERTSTINADLSIYSDAARTTHIAGSPISFAIPATITGLRYLQASNYDDNNGAADEKIGWIDDVGVGHRTVTATGVSSGEIIVTATQENALSHDGADDYTTCSNPTFTADLQGTISFWAYPEANGAILGFSKLSSGVVDEFHINVGGAAGVEYFTLEVQNNSVYTHSLRTPAGSALDNAWYHFTMTSNGSTTLMYINGQSVAINAAVGAADGVWFGNMVTDADLIVIGAFARSGSYIDDWTGELYDVRVYDVALPPADVLELYNETFTDDTDPESRWPLNEGTGSVAFDVAGGFDGAINGATWDIGLFKLFIDGVREDWTRGASVPDNANNWTFVENGSMTYMESHEITIDGVQAQLIEWEYGTTFTDQSANTNDATPTFRTVSNNLNVTAELTSLSPVAEAELATFSLSEITDILTTAPDAIPQMYSELDFTYIPFAPAVNAILDEGGVPQALWWFPFIFMGIVIIMFMVYGLTTRRVFEGRMTDVGNQGSLLLMCIVGGVLLTYAGIMEVVPFWPAILCWIPFTAIMLSTKHRSVG